MEKRFTIKEEINDRVIRAGESVFFSFCADGMRVHDKHSLFFTCEDRKYFPFKAESQNDKLYMILDDSLDYDHARNDTYCLNMSCDAPKAFAKRAAFTIYWNRDVAQGQRSALWNLGISAKAENLAVCPDGYLRLRLEKWLLREGVEPGATNAAPDETILLDIPEGSYDYQVLKTAVQMDDATTACVLVTLEGIGYAGSIYLETPFLRCGEGDNLLPPFDVGVLGAEKYAWCGQNLSQREWPQFVMTLNGKTFFEGEVFLRMHRYSPVELEIPQGLILPGENRLEIAYTSAYNRPLPVAIRQMEILERPARPFVVRFCPDFVEADGLLRVLLETQQEDLSLECISDDFLPVSSLSFSQKGLHGLTLKPQKVRHDMTFLLRCGEWEEHCRVDRTVYRQQDHVLCGSGDMIYVDSSDEKTVMTFLSWFMEQELGKLVTIRPVYHWGGQRTLEPKVWERFKEFCREMGLSYVLMSDGRDLSGIDKNPSIAQLQGEGFLGRQVHERDGQLFYWGMRPRDTQPISNTFFDLAMRLFRENPEHGEGNYNPNNIICRDGYTSFRRDLLPVADRKVAHDTVARLIRQFAEDFPRHTGPAVVYKYFYEQGFSWLGAETMDGAMEGQLAFLRGAAKAYGKDKTGIHHALQWSTYPHDTPQRYRRFLLANYVSYMHGMTDINTEEGFWFMEAESSYFNRLSQACEEHRKMQRIFHRFLSTHSRTGLFHTPTALLYGRYDGWNGFYQPYLWGMANLPVGEAEDSWKLLKLFYPLNHVVRTGMAKTGYIPEDNDQPFGCYSGTPRGNVDVIPVENGLFAEYRLLCFAGYNAAEPQDLDRLRAYVQQGGTLLASWLHFSPTTADAQIAAKQHTILQHPLTERLSDGAPVFETDTVLGAKIRVCTNLPQDMEVIEKTDSGRPLIFAVNDGKGKLYLLNAFSYPGEDAVYEPYARMLAKLHDAFMAQEPASLVCGEDVGYTLYLQENGQIHLYITPVDWYRDPTPKRHAALKLGESRYPMELDFGILTKVVVQGEVAAWTEDMEAEVLRVDADSVTVQGYHDTTVFVAKEGALTRYPVSFGAEPKKTLTFA